ncbi:MAG: GtrA family protein [Mesorhizobium sp.]|nr:GtrA family protein [Mesorhizobium sp.]
MRKVFVFGLVGVTASIVHFLLAAGLFTYAGINLFVANLFGFFLAISVSYFGHYYLTFRSKQAHGTAVRRFVVTALTGFAVNNLCLAMLTWAIGHESPWSLGTAIIVAAAVVYLLSGRWAFAAR